MMNCVIFPLIFYIGKQEQANQVIIFFFYLLKTQKDDIWNVC